MFSELSLVLMTESYSTILQMTHLIYLGQNLDAIYKMLVVNCSKIPLQGAIEAFLTLNILIFHEPLGIVVNSLLFVGAMSFQWRNSNSVDIHSNY